jgi:hypothetical protein
MLSGLGPHTQTAGDVEEQLEQDLVQLAEDVDDLEQPARLRSGPGEVRRARCDLRTRGCFEDADDQMHEDHEAARPEP